MIGYTVLTIEYCDLYSRISHSKWIMEPPSSIQRHFDSEVALKGFCEATQTLLSTAPSSMNRSGMTFIQSINDFLIVGYEKWLCRGGTGFGSGLSVGRYSTFYW